MEFLKLWDYINNIKFKPIDFEGFKCKPGENGNIRDYASIIELSILSNIEYHNSLLIKENLSQKDRLIILNKEANKQKELFNKNLKLNNQLENKSIK